jgi:hypothetical protein
MPDGRQQVDGEGSGAPRVLTRRPASIPIRILTLIIAALILVGGPPGGVVIRPAAAQAQSNPSGAVLCQTCWMLSYDAQVEYDSEYTELCGYGAECQLATTITHQFYQLATESYLNVTEGKVGSFRTSVGEYVAMSDWYSTLSVNCSVELRDSLVFDVTGSVTGQVVKLSASSPTITPTETQSSGNVAECPTSYGSYLQSFPGIKHLRWVDGYTFSDAPENLTSGTSPDGLPYTSQVISSLTVGLWRLQSYCNQFAEADLPPVCVESGNDDQGSISPPANIPSPNTVTLSDGSTIHLGGSTLSWNSPGNFTVNCPQTCASDSFNFLNDSRGTIVSVNCPTGPCATITALRGANFSLSAAANHATVNDFDGIVQVSALNSSSTVFLSGALGTYSQRVTVNTNENFTTLQKNATTTYATVPPTCNGGTINSGQPISGDLNSTQFCVPAGQVTKLQFSVPPSLQNMESLYTATSNSSAISILASGENKTGTAASGVMALSGIPTEMPIPLISPSGNDPVAIAVNNTGSANAVVTFQLQFPSLTTASTTSTYLLVTAIVLTVLVVVASFLVIRSRRHASR